ncbi:MAG: low temperature requirement protein A [Actinobacteria bacterium]|nr:low temperature requirement protein A [Actinomycetota bacterium]MCB9413032.1 low temperature requirement protein A [Actinomycetota bacterium]
MATVARAEERHNVSTLELFFDLVFVFAITQVTALLAADPTLGGVLRGVLLLALVYWSWVAYSWLGTSARVDDRTTTAAMLGAMAAMFVAAVLLPQWFSGGGLAVAAALAYAAVRVMHLLMFLLLGSGSPGLRAATLRLAGSVLVSVVLLLVGAVVGGSWQLVFVFAAVLIDPIGAFLGKGEGWYLSAEHFAERHGLIMIIALGESLIALGLAVSGYGPTVALIGLSVFGALLASLVYALYFRRTAAPLLEALDAVVGAAQARFGRDVYSYGHFPLIAGVVALALVLKKSASAVAKDGWWAELSGIAPGALLAAALLIVGGVLLLRVRAGVGVRGQLAAGLVLASAGGVAAWFTPAAMALIIFAAGLATAIGVPARFAANEPAQRLPD